MTSVLRRYAQIDPRSQNIIVLSDCSGRIYDPAANIPSSPVMPKSDFLNAYPNKAIFLNGQLLKDLGRSINVYDPAYSNNLYQIFRQVMWISGTRGTGRFEGVTNQIAYVCTWSADGTGQADLARMG